MSAPALGPDTVGRSDELHGPAYEWAIWSTTMRLVTADPHALPSARRLVDAELAHVELATSRMRRDSEVASLPAGRRVRISHTLTQVLSSALWAARETRGAVDPTLGHALESIGHDRLGTKVPGLAGVSTVSGARWEGIELDEQAQTLLLPRGVQLDLGDVSRAWAADRCAAVVAEVLGVGVLVSLGGDIATAGPPGSAGGGAWEILVQDEPGDPSALIAVPTGLAVATASTLSSQWRAGGRELHHLLSPATGMPASSLWRSATVVAQDCVTASTWATAALVDGSGAMGVVESSGYPTRLVAADGSVSHRSGWPADAEDALAG